MIIYYKTQANDNQKLLMTFRDTIDHTLSLPLLLIRYLVEWNRTGYSFEQLIGFTFANRMDRASGGKGINFNDLDFKYGLLGL